MPKMKDRNAQLRGALGAIAPKERIVEANSIPNEDTVNRQGKAAYSYDDKLPTAVTIRTETTGNFSALSLSDDKDILIQIAVTPAVKKILKGVCK